MNWGETISAVSAAVAAVSFISGVSAWKRESVGRRRMDLAESVLALFYEADDSIAMIRSPFSFGGEGGTRERGANETPEESNALDQAYVAFERYQKKEQLFAQLQSTRYRFMATFGPEAAEPFNDLDSAIKDVLIAARALGTRYWQDQRRRVMDRKQSADHLQKMQKYESIFWAGEDDDPIAPRVKDAIKKVEAIAKREVDAMRRQSFFSRKKSSGS